MSRVLRGWNDWPITHKSLALVSLPLLLLVGSLFAIYSLERQNSAAENDVRDTLEVIRDLYEAHALLAETAAGIRGYRLVQHEDFLAPYRTAEPQLQQVVERLSRRITDLEQAARFARIKPLFAEKLLGWRQMLQPRLSEEEETRQLWDGKQRLDILRAELRELSVRETAQLQVRTARAQALRQRNLYINLGAALLCGFCAVCSVGWFASALSQRLRGLAANADRLGEGLPLLPRQHDGDEIGQVEQRLSEASALLAARAAEAQLARREAETANRAKTEFLSRSSHELRTPLNAILGYAQVLQMDAVTPLQRAQLQQILTAGRHLLELITELLDIARIEVNRLDLVLEAVPLALAINQAVGLLGPDAAARNIVLEVESAHPPLCVRADPQRLRQVLLNLLSNAIKFNRQAGRVQIRVQPEHERVRILITDQGPGLSSAQIARLFTPFERLGAEHSAVPGTGLGLALSKHLIEAMGGSIGVDSRGAGACFWISLPQERAAAPVSSGLTAETRLASQSARLILSVEDNPSNQALIRTLCERRPQWRLTEANNLGEAEALLACSRPDLILLDLHLSDGNGEQLLARLNAVQASPPVLVISADATDATLERLRALGVHGCLSKPLDVTAFYECLDEVLA
jgi:signal transduction histidine kinase